MNIKFDTKKFLVILLMQAPTIMDAAFMGAAFVRPPLYANQKIAKSFCFNGLVKPLAAISDNATTYYVADVFSSLLAAKITGCLFSTGISLYKAYDAVKYGNPMPFFTKYIYPMTLSAMGIYSMYKTYSYMRNAAEIQKNFPYSLNQNMITSLNLPQYCTWRYRCSEARNKSFDLQNNTGDSITLPTYWITADSGIGISRSHSNIQLKGTLQSTAQYNHSNYENAVKRMGHENYQIIKVKVNNTQLEVIVPYVATRIEQYFNPADILYAVKLHDQLPIEKEAQRDTLQLTIDADFILQYQTSFKEIPARILDTEATVIPISISSSMNSKQ